MRSAIDARGSTITAVVALLAGIALIAGSLLRAGHGARSVDVVSRTFVVPVQTPHVEQAAARTSVIRRAHVERRAMPLRFPSPDSGVPEAVGLTVLDDLAVPSAPSTSTLPLSQPEKADGLATAAADFGDGLARGSQKAGARTAGFFKRFGRKVAASFGR